jgi:hypothetical protein
MRAEEAEACKKSRLFMVIGESAELGVEQASARGVVRCQRERSRAQIENLCLPKHLEDNGLRCYDPQQIYAVACSQGLSISNPVLQLRQTLTYRVPLRSICLNNLAHDALECCSWPMPSWAWLIDVFLHSLLLLLLLSLPSSLWHELHGRCM